MVRNEQERLEIIRMRSKLCEYAFSYYTLHSLVKNGFINFLLSNNKWYHYMIHKYTTDPLTADREKVQFF